MDLFQEYLVSVRGVITDRHSADILLGDKNNNTGEWPLVLAVPSGEGERLARVLEEQFYYYVEEEIKGGGLSQGLYGFRNLCHFWNEHRIHIHDSPTGAAEDAVHHLPLTSQRTTFSGRVYNIPWPDLFFDRKLVVVQAAQVGMDDIAAIQADLNMDILENWLYTPDYQKDWTVGTDSVFSTHIPQVHSGDIYNRHAR